MATKILNINKEELKIILLGVIAGVIAFIVIDRYKKKNESLEYGEKKIVEEIKDLRHTIDTHIGQKS